MIKPGVVCHVTPVRTQLSHSTHCRCGPGHSTRLRSPPTGGWLSRTYAYLLSGRVLAPHSYRRVARLLNSALFTFQGGFDRQLREALGPLFPEGLLPSLAEGASAAIQVCKFWCSGVVQACKAGSSFTAGCLSATRGLHAVGPLHDQRLMMATRAEPFFCRSCRTPSPSKLNRPVAAGHAPCSASQLTRPVINLPIRRSCWTPSPSKPRPAATAWLATLQEYWTWFA